MADNGEAQLWPRRSALRAGLALAASPLAVVLGRRRALGQPVPAVAGRRLALVVTNQDYASDLGKLANTYRDGDLVVEALRGASFDLPDTRVARDLNKEQFRNAFEAFAVKVSEAGENAVGCFYYSGHGSAGRDQRNYAVPIGASVKSDADLPTEGIELRWMLDKLHDAGSPTNIVFFDACRDIQTARAKGGTKGLQPQGIVGTGQDSIGRFVMYATDYGATAADTNVFALALAEEIKRVPGRELLNLVADVRRSVVARTNRSQMPQFEPGYIEQEFYFQPRESATSGAQGRAPQTGEPAAKNPEVKGALWRVLETFENGRLYFKTQARLYKQPSRIADQVGLMPAGEEIKSRIEYADAGADGVWYKFTDNFGQTVYVRATDALALKE